MTPMAPMAPLLRNLAKGLLAWTLIAALIAWAGHRGAPPDWELAHRFGWVFLVGGGVLAGLLALLVLQLQIRQWMFEHGATDVQWLKVPADPPGAQGPRAAHTPTSKD